MSVNGPSQQRSRLQHEERKLPVTALAFYSDGLLLSGEGTRLHAYGLNSQACLASVQIFPSQAIHGIIVESGSKDVLVYGGRFVRHVKAIVSANGVVHFGLGNIQTTGDWILDASFAPVDQAGDPQAALITAHNALFVATLRPSDGFGEEEEVSWEISCRVPGSNSILYSAHMTWLSIDHVLVASGTAFGDVVVWSCKIRSYSTDTNLSTAPQPHCHYAFSAHDGSIFGLRISGLLDRQVLGGRKRVLASCSDDRAIRLWDLSDLSDQSASLTDLQRSTGFGTSSTTDAAAPLLLAKAMGHMSRIWSVRFDRGSSGELQIKSFGEDAKVIDWEVEYRDSKAALPYTLSELQTNVPHAGKNIWSVAMDDCGHIATGGADGMIAVLAPYASRMMETVEVGKSIMILKRETADNDTIKSYAFIAPRKLVATTQMGRIVVIDLDGNGNMAAEDVLLMNNLKSYSIVTALPGLAFAGGVNGMVYAYIGSSGEWDALACGSGKIAGLFGCAIQEKSAQEKSVVGLLVTNVSSTTARLFRLEYTNEGAKLDRPLVCTLSLPPAFVVTSFVRLSCEDGVDLAVLGSRNGALAVFALPLEDPAEALSLRCLLDRVHGKEAVTSLRWLPSSYSSARKSARGLLFSTGRDGTFAVHRILGQSNQTSITLETVHQIELPFGPNIEELALMDSGELLVWGFRSKHFVVYSVTSQREIMTVECGGAHRNWAFHPHTSGEGGTFVWTKAGKVYSRDQTALPYRSISSGGHGREIKALAVSRSSGNEPLIATGAEDTDIRLFTLEPASIPSPHDRPDASPERPRLRCVQLLRKHNTGPQHLAFSPCGRYLFSSGGFEELFVWRIERDLPRVGVGVVCESMHPRTGKSDLRITSFDVREIQNDRDSATQRWQITTTYSDSRVAIWTYAAEDQWQHVAEAEYLTACPTAVFDLRPPGVDDRLLTTAIAGHLLTTATDGHLALWRSAPDPAGAALAWTSRHRAHQSAILSALPHRLSDGSRLVVTGGDDNAISLTRVPPPSTDGNGTGTGTETSTLTIPNAHAAAVTALALPFVTPRRDVPGQEALCLLTAGLDQRVRMWRVEVDVSGAGVAGVEVRKVGSAWIGVADVAGLDVIVPDGGVAGDDGWRVRVVVAGVGVEVLTLCLGDFIGEPRDGGGYGAR